MTALRCQRGAVMVTTIFMLCFLVAMLYMVIGIGKTLVMREGMQDAADAAAYSSAIFNARGMNLIVFINLLMAALVSVLVALRLAQTFLAMIAVALAAAAWGSFGATAPLAAKATHMSMQMGQRFKDAKRIIEPILEGLHTTQEAVSVVVPLVAMTHGMLEAAQHHKPARGAFAIPGSTSLPIEADEFSTLCGHSSEFLVNLAFAPVPRQLSGLQHLVGDAAKGIGESTSGFLCGDGGGQPPSYEQKYDKHLPRHPDESKCGDDENAAACQELDTEIRAAAPRKRTGACQEDCGYHGPYETMARRARLSCEPTPTFRPRAFVWQGRLVKATFTYNGVTWLESSRSIVRTMLEDTKRPPCGLGGSVDNVVWNRVSGPVGTTEPHALCREEIPELKETPAPNTSVSLEFLEVARVFSCVVKETKTHSLADADDALGGSGSEKKSPHRVEKDLNLGGEAFQIRAIAFGERPGPGSARDGVVLAHHGEGSVSKRWQEAAPVSGPGGAALSELAETLGNLSVAQAEYYFAGSAPSSEWMWEMKWSARLRHFRLPSEEEEKQQSERLSRTQSEIARRADQFGGLDPRASVVRNCEDQGGQSCGGTSQALSLFDAIVRH